MYDFLAVVLNSTESILMALVIALFATAAYFFWFRPALRASLADLTTLKAALSNASGEWPQIQIHMRETLRKVQPLASCWLETEQRVMAVSTVDGMRRVMMVSPRDIWNADSVLSRRINTSLAEATPNLLVGSGLFFTFFFLAMALISTTSTLMTDGATSQQTEVAIQNLLSVAGAKFLTSLVGLGASLLWIFVAKRWQSSLEKVSEEFLDALSHHVSPYGAEFLAAQQAEQGQEALQYADELIAEVRDQSGVLKRFETDLVLAMKGQTDRMIDSIDRLAKSLQGIQAETLQKMMEQFLGLLQKMTQDEFARFRDALIEATDALQDSAEQLGVGAAHLTDAAGVIKDGVYEFEQCLEAATTRGSRGIALADTLLSRVDDSQQALQHTTSGLQATASDVGRIVEHIGLTTERVDQLSREQMRVVESVQALVPKTTMAAEQLGQVMSDAVRTTKNGMEATARTLGEVVQEITQGITAYSEQVGNLHGSMDEQMAKAIGSLDSVISQLSSQVDSLRDLSLRQVSEVSVTKLIATLENLKAERAQVS